MHTGRNPLCCASWGWFSGSMHYMWEVTSLITLEQHQLCLIIILLLQYLVPLMLPSTSTAVFIISRYYRGKTTGKRIVHDFCPPAVSDINFFVNHMYRFCFLWVEIATLTHRHTHMLQPKKISCVSLLQLRLSCSPYDNQNSSSLVIDHWCCLVLIFHSNLRDQKLELHSPHYMGAGLCGLEMFLLSSSLHQSGW